MPSEMCIKQYHKGEFEQRTTIYGYVKYNLCMCHIR